MTGTKGANLRVFSLFRACWLRRWEDGDDARMQIKTSSEQSDLQSNPTKPDSNLTLKTQTEPNSKPVAL